jgi:hypothetical protein
MLKRLKSPHEVYAGELSQLSRWHRHHADFLMLRGESDRARKELEEDLDLFRSVPLAETALPEFDLGVTTGFQLLSHGACTSFSML